MTDFFPPWHPGAPTRMEDGTTWNPGAAVNVTAGGTVYQKVRFPRPGPGWEWMWVDMSGFEEPERDDDPAVGTLRNDSRDTPGLVSGSRVYFRILESGPYRGCGEVVRWEPPE